MKDVIHFYRVNNLENIRYFYEEVLALKRYKDQGKCLIYDTGGHGKLGFCTHHPANINDNTCITFVYATQAEVDQKYRHFKALGITKNEPSKNETFNIYHFFIKDNEGMTLEFQTFL